MVARSIHGGPQTPQRRLDEETADDLDDAGLIYIVMDNLSAHWTADIRQWAINNNVGLLPTPTNASHLNRIECHFWAYVEFVINGSDHTDWDEFNKATQAYIRRPNRDHHDPRIRELEKRRKVA